MINSEPIKISFEENELPLIAAEMFPTRLEEAIDKLIRFLRHMEKENPESGYQALVDLMATHGLPISMFMQIKETLRHPEAPYTIVQL